METVKLTAAQKRKKLRESLEIGEVVMWRTGLYVVGSWSPHSKYLQSLYVSYNRYSIRRGANIKRGYITFAGVFVPKKRAR
jgi:hypothetical protein